MSLPDRVQCPFCLARIRLKGDGTMHRHKKGKPRRLRLCPGTARTLDEAKVAKSVGPPYEVLSGRPDSLHGTSEVRPEDIF